jgi:GH24 family phage-related lysozyme (muramidase)
MLTKIGKNCKIVVSGGGEILPGLIRRRNAESIYLGK